MGTTAGHSNRSQVFAFFDACEPATQFCNTLADRSARFWASWKNWCGVSSLAIWRSPSSGAIAGCGRHRVARARALEAISNLA
jgi:hypothetical protein